jgi:ABC-type polysaccharide/polyol phosphate export permease
MLVFTIIFGRIARLPADGTAPYPLMFFAGILPWTFFDGVERGLQQSDQQREPDQQGLFPTADRAMGESW